MFSKMMFASGRGSAWSLRLFVASALALAVAPTLANGQVAIRDRHLEGISILPFGTAPNTYRIYAIWSASVETSSVPQNMSTEIDFVRNGVLVATANQVAIANYALGCSGGAGACTPAGCGTWDTGSEMANAFCRVPPSGSDCSCGALFITPHSAPIPVLPGDEITVIILPATGALPDSNPGDNVQSLVFTAPIPLPNRAMESISVSPAPVGGASQLINISWRAEAGRSTVPYDLSAEVVVLIDGVTLSSSTHTLQKQPGVGSCEGFACDFPTACDLWNSPSIAAPVAGTCFFSPSQQNCACAYVFAASVPAAPLVPGDEITVILRPAPGALPDLFPSDDTMTLVVSMPPNFRRGDCNDDGLYNVADVISLLGELFSGTAPAPCDDACDANNDGLKNIGDAIFMLSSLFSGGPPPPAPHTTCGTDPTPPDGLGCATHESCP